MTKSIIPPDFTHCPICKEPYGEYSVYYGSCKDHLVITYFDKKIMRITMIIDGLDIGCYYGQLKHTTISISDPEHPDYHLNILETDLIDFDYSSVDSIKKTINMLLTFNNR